MGSGAIVPQVNCYSSNKFAVQGEALRSWIQRSGGKSGSGEVFREAQDSAFCSDSPECVRSNCRLATGSVAMPKIARNARS